MTDVLCLHPEDDVANVLGPVRAGDVLRGLPAGGVLTASGAAPRYHKIALRPLACGVPVRRNGIVIGVTTAAIAAGAHVHSHNLRSQRARVRAQDRVQDKDPS